MHDAAISLGILVLYNASEKLIKGEPRDMVAERGVIACAQAVADALESVGYRVVRLPFQGDVETVLQPYPSTDWLVFNLAEGMEGKLFEEARIAWTLEAMGYRFTGNRGDAIALSTHKARAKRVLSAAGVPTPAFWLFRHPDEVRMAAGLPFPLIVKPVAEDASQGIGSDSVVHSMDALHERVAYIAGKYHQAALAETFVAGREFNVGLWGDPPEALPLAEIDFSAFADPYARIVSFSAKWEEQSFEYRHTPVFCPALVDVALGTELVKVARRAWDALGCRGYARVDIRVSEAGTPYVVEVNCNPDISPDAGFFRAARQAGYTYEQMVARIVQFTLKEC